MIADRQRIPELQRDVLDGEVNPPVLAIAGQRFRFIFKGMRKRGSVGKSASAAPVGWGLVPSCLQNLVVVQFLAYPVL